IRIIWRTAEGNGAFGAIVRFLLLSGQRPGDAFGMAWDELDADGVWTIPAARYKTGRPHTVPLSKAALEIAIARPRAGTLVFPDRDGSRFPNNGYRKQLLDA